MDEALIGDVASVEDDRQGTSETSTALKLPDA
jgi:hypothetical protein